MAAGHQNDVADRLEIAEVLAVYATALDTRDWDLLASVFTEDATCDYGATGCPTGIDDIARTISRMIEPLDATQHLIGNVVARIDGDSADCSCYLISQHIRRNTPGGDEYMIGGRYTDRLVRTPQGWRISHRTLTRQWAMGNRAVVLRDY